MERGIRRKSDHSSIPGVRSESSVRKEMFERPDVRCYGQRGVAAAGGSAPAFAGSFGLAGRDASRQLRTFKPE